MAKKEVLPTDLLLRNSFIYPEGLGSRMGNSPKDRPIAMGTGILEARISPKYKPSKSKVR